jgi:RNA polymerase sigma factor (sigma-70 family)
MNFRYLGEVELWNLVVGGNEEAFAHIYSSYSWELYKYGHKFTQDADLIEDVIQDVFVTIWELRKGILIQRSIKYYLFSSFRREMIKRVNISYKSETLEEYHSKIAWEASFQEILEENQITVESRNRGAQALEHLPARQKEAIYLRYIQELSYEEISDMMGVQITSLYNLIFKGIKALKTSLSTSG